MARKYDMITELYAKTSEEIVSSPHNWEAFLRSACLNFRLRFDEQLLVFAQRPDATAVLGIEKWNDRYGRWVKRGAKGIAVFEDAERSRQRLTHYFDISDTHESRYSRPVPLWEMHEEYKQEVIDTLEGSFGELEDKSTFSYALFCAAKNVTEDNLDDYISDFLIIAKETGIEDATEAENLFRNIVLDSTAYMLCCRLGANSASVLQENCFDEIEIFSDPRLVNALGIAISDIAQMMLSEISRTILTLDRKNRIIARQNENTYNENRNKAERSNQNDRNKVHETGRLRDTESESAKTAGSESRTVRKNETEISERAAQNNVLQPADELQVNRAFVGNRTESERDGENTASANVEERGIERKPESGRHDDVGTQSKQYTEPGTGDRAEGSSLRLGWYDRKHEDKSLPFFGSTEDINKILIATPHLKASKEEIRAFYESNPDREQRTEYIKEIFNDDYTELIIDDDRRVGYKTYENVLQLWEGSYDSRTAQSFYNWGVIAEHFEGLRLLGKLHDTAKPLPSMDGQRNQINKSAEEKYSAFVFSQEIIDAVLTRGSGFDEGKMRIYRQFEQSFSAKENADFLKNEYGVGGVYPAIIGAEIDESHDSKGIRISRGIGIDNTHIDLKWNQVAKRIAELIRLDRYLSPKEKAYYPEWLQKEEDRRAQHEQERRKREILLNSPDEKTAERNRLAKEETPATAQRYEYHLGDMVTIGAQDYEILSFDDNRVLLYDPQFPLFQEEIMRDEFDRKVQENPMNDHLKVREEPAKEEVPENESDSFDINEYDDPDYYEQRRLAEQEVQEQTVQHFDSIEFEKLIPHEMRFKEADIVNDNEMFWVTQEPFTVEQLRQFQQAVKKYDSEIKKFYVTPRDLSGYNFEEDLVRGVLAVVTPDMLLKDDYVRAMKEEGLGNYLLSETTGQASVEETRYDIGMGYHGNGLTVWNRAEEVNGDYQTIAHISTEGEIHYYADSLPDDVVQTIERAAETERQNNRFTALYWEYAEIKQDNHESIVLFQVGDFFEMYNEDAKAAAEALELTLGSRSIGSNQRVPMCGIPAHRLQTYMDMLRDRGHDVVIAAVENGRRNILSLPSDCSERAQNEEVKSEAEPLTPAINQPKKERIHSFDLHPEIPMADRHTFNLSANPVEEVGKKERFRRNVEAICVLKTCESENRFATPEEQTALSKYVGWGGIPEAFDENNSAWADEYSLLKSTLTPDEYTSARESILTAFFTPPVVIEAIYKAMEQIGFREGNLLEPSCGIGNFIGLLPQTMQNSKIYGVEIDTVSAGIAQQLYQRSSIAAQAFEEVNIPDNFFDGIIGNVPFGDIRVNDRRYNKYNFLIHDYFLTKSLDKLRPGGVMALVTNRGTMDKESTTVRKYIAQRADLLGAIRLPNNTFKGNAGTEVVSDILFLQKRDRIIDIEPDWVYLDTNPEGIRMNSYFVQHPEMILGEIKMISGRFGMEQTCKPYEGADLSEQLAEAISNIHGEISISEQEEEFAEEDNSIPADPTVRNFSFTLCDGKVYYRENSRMAPVELSATAENRAKGLIGIRDSVRRLIELQTEDFPDSEIRAEQEKLNCLYDAFTEKYGLINSRANSTVFSPDSSFALLAALEVIDENGKLERKADIFTKRTIKSHTPVTSVDTAIEAYALSMGEKACVDMEYMQSLTGKSEEELYDDLKGVIFLNPLYSYGSAAEQKYLSADEYLSGNVREKLSVARQSAEAYPEDYTVNVEALEKVQPKSLTASEISVQLGTTWLPPEIVEEFVFSFLDTPRYARWNIHVHYSEFTGEWNIEGKSYDRTNLKAHNTYGTSRINAYKIIEETLNLRDIRIFDYIKDEEGKKKAVLNTKETEIAQAKQELIKQGFQDWIWSDPTRRENLCRMYNERFNSIRPREYDGSYIQLDGMNPEIELREHQKNAVAHILYGGNTLLAHAVGAGKTYEMTAAAMELKRLGLCQKSLFVVPNHLTEQWASEFLQLYPAANILVATKKDFETKNRKKFCARIATGDYDAVIIGHLQLEKIPISIERQRALLEQQIKDISVGIKEFKKNRGDSFTVKQLERSRKGLKVKLEKLNDQSKKDDVVTFEELGIDRLFIDESHYYKNSAKRCV